MKTFQKYLHTIQLLGIKRSAWFASQLLRKPNPAHIWEEDQEFLSLYRKIENFTLTDQKRCFQLYQMALSVAELPGHFAEIGVYRGGTALLLGTIAKHQSKKLHLFDTFAGMPETESKKDFVQKGDFADTSLKSVQKLLENLDNCSYHPGFFPKTANGLLHEKFSFVHVDVDMFQSVWDCCAFFQSRMVPGGIIIFDDYGFITTEGARLAVDQFYRDTPIKPIYSPTGQSFVVCR